MSSQTRANRGSKKGAHQFSQIPRADIPRSAFNRSCNLKTTFDSGLLIPIFADEALPGDTMNLNVAHFARMATPIHPVMENMYLDMFFFAVPMRLLWDNWQKFNGEQTDPGDSTDFIIPTMTPPGGGYANGSLSDHLGIPPEVDTGAHSAMWHRAYNLIYKEWFRDQNLTDSPVVDVDDGPDDPADYVLLKRAKRHDYFTSCLPFPQKGPAVELSFGGTAPLGGVATVGHTGGVPQFDPVTGGGAGALTVSTINPVIFAGALPGSQQDLEWADTGGLLSDLTTEAFPGGMPFADLSMATGATINAIRQAFQIQKLYERDARGGTRYTEIVRSHFGVVSPDQRLQRPEYLGGGSSLINVNPVPQTSVAGGETPQGNLAAFVTSSSAGRGFAKSFTEHCVIIGLAMVRADLSYQQGLNRMFSRSTRWDFYWPALAHLGEQAVLNKEIFLSEDTDIDNAVFGYQERFAEYRYKPSLITGQMRSSFATSLDTWHLAQDFAALPLLNDTFISENVPIARIIAVPTEPEFLFDAFFDYRCVRPMPVYSVPGLVDHF